MVYRDDNCGIDPQMYCDSKLRDFFNSYQSMQDSFGGIRARLLRRGAELVRRWQKSPPIPDMDSGLNLWSEKNLDLIAGSDVSSGDIFSTLVKVCCVRVEIRLSGFFCLGCRKIITSR